MSLRSASAMARRMLRPIRPNPLMATRTVMETLPASLDSKMWMPGTRPDTAHLTQLLYRRCGNRFSGNPEFLVQFLVRRARAERIHSDEDSIGTDNGIPALTNCGFDTDPHLCVADDSAPVFLALRMEQFEAGHRDHACRNAALGKQFCTVNRNRNFGTSGEDRDVGAAVRARYLIGAMRADIVVVEPAAQLWKILPCEGKDARPVVGLERQL